MNTKTPALGCAIWLFAAGLAVAGPLFPGARYVTGTSPRHVEIGDFDKNGLPDLVVTSRDGLSLFLGRGEGEFADGQRIGAFTWANALTVADFDGDDLEDLAVGSSDGVSVLRGQGGGVFATAQTVYSDAGSVSFLATGDLDGNGAADLVIVHGSGDRVSILNVQRRKLEALNLASYFDVVIFSDRWGRDAWKPNPRPFQEALKRLKSESSDTIYVADNPEKDFIGAKNAGLKSVRVRYPKGLYSDLNPESSDHAPDIEIQGIESLEKAIESLSDF